MRTLTPAELARLRRSASRLRISLLVFLVLLIAGVVGLVASGMSVVPGPMLGVLIGLLLLMPHRRVVRELGLTNAEANAILVADAEQRRGITDLTPAARAERSARLARICLAVGLPAAGGFALAALYLFSYLNANPGPVENGTEDPLWVPISIFGGFVAVLVAIIFLVAAKQHRKEARAWQAKDRAGEPSTGTSANGPASSGA